MKSPRKEGKPAEDSLSSSPCKKRCLPNDANESSATKKKKSAMLDVATKLGYNEGDRIEVYWKRGIDDNSRISQWWCAKLLPHDGRCLENDSEENEEDNNSAIRVLEYDAHPAGGFPTTTRQDVIFVASNVLISFGQEERRLLFRREGSKEEFGEEKITADDVVWFDEDGLRIEIDSTIMGALKKHSKKWDQIPASQRAVIAEMIATKKERLLNELLDHGSGDSEGNSRSNNDNDIITSNDMKGILGRIMEDE